MAELTLLGDNVFHSGASSSVTDEWPHGEIVTERLGGKACSVMVDALLTDETEMDDSVGDRGGGGS